MCMAFRKIRVASGLMNFLLDSFYFHPRFSLLSRFYDHFIELTTKNTHRHYGIFMPMNGCLHALLPANE